MRNKQVEIQSLYLYFIKIVPFWLRNIWGFLYKTPGHYSTGVIIRRYTVSCRFIEKWMSKFFLMLIVAENTGIVNICYYSQPLSVIFQNYSSVARLATHLVKTINIRAVIKLTKKISSFISNSVLRLLIDLLKKTQLFPKVVRNKPPVLPETKWDFAKTMLRIQNLRKTFIIAEHMNQNTESRDIAPDRQ